MFWWIFGSIVVGIVILILYPALVAGSRADDNMERWYEEHKIKDE